jgi:hypothetical protein
MEDQVAETCADSLFSREARIARRIDMKPRTPIALMTVHVTRTSGA